MGDQYNNYFWEFHQQLLIGLDYEKPYDLKWMG